MATYNEKAIHRAVLRIGVGAMFIANPDFANAQSNNKTSMLLPGAQTPHRENATSLTVEQARAIVAPLNEPSKKDVPALLANATIPDYQSCSTNSDCLSRDQLAGVFTAWGKIIPNLH
jgi:hypothetical protein